MIFVVLDTNVLVSAMLKPGGAEAFITKLALAGSIQVFVTASILDEYDEVLGRSKFKHIEVAVIEKLLAQIRSSSILVNPTKTLAVSPDESDNRFLECAEAANADYLVTGNKRHFPLRWKNTAIIGARELIQIVLNAVPRL